MTDYHDNPYAWAQEQFHKGYFDGKNFRKDSFEANKHIMQYHMSWDIGYNHDGGRETEKAIQRRIENLGKL